MWLGLEKKTQNWEGRIAQIKFLKVERNKHVCWRAEKNEIHCGRNMVGQTGTEIKLKVNFISLCMSY